MDNYSLVILHCALHLDFLGPVPPSLMIEYSIINIHSIYLFYFCQYNFLNFLFLNKLVAKSTNAIIAKIKYTNPKTFIP